MFQKFKEDDIQVFYTYKTNRSYQFQPKHFKWTQTHVNLNLLFNNLNTNSSNSVFILKPNGEYFVSNKKLPKVFLKEILKKGNWKKSKQQLLSTIQTNSSSGIGIFADYHELVYYDVPQKIMIIGDNKRRQEVMNANPDTKVFESRHDMYNNLPNPNFCFSIDDH